MDANKKRKLEADHNVQASMDVLGIKPEKETSAKLTEMERMKIAKTRFNETSNEMTALLQKRSNEYHGIFHKREFSTEEGYLNLKPAHFIKEIQGVQEVQRRREEAWEEYNTILKKAFSERGSFYE
jgi:acetylglutamate kinase